jgi:hypothetical protein
MWGDYRSHRLGIYSYNNNKTVAGYVDIDYFRYKYNNFKQNNFTAIMEVKDFISLTYQTFTGISTGFWP